MSGELCLYVLQSDIRICSYALMRFLVMHNVAMLLPKCPISFNTASDGTISILSPVSNDVGCFCVHMHGSKQNVIETGRSEASRSVRVLI